MHIAARQVQDVDPETISADDDEALVNYIHAEVRKRTSRNVMRSWAVRGTCCAFGAVSSSAWKLVGLSIFS